VIDQHLKEKHHRVGALQYNQRGEKMKSKGKVRVKKAASRNGTSERQKALRESKGEGISFVTLIAGKKKKDRREKCHFPKAGVSGRTRT